jgi:hypothetical protein
MSLSPSELMQLKNVLGYGNLTALALPYVDVALMFETVIEGNLDLEGESLIRQYLGEITQVESDIFTTRQYFGVKKVDEIELDPSQQAQQLRELRSWLVQRCSETCKVPIARKQNRGSCVEVY